MKLRFTLVLEVPIKSDEELVSYYEAASLEEAVEHQQAWCDDGSCDLTELIGNAEEVSVLVEGVK